LPTGLGTTGAQKYKEGTLTLSWLPADSFELRGEVRQDSADQDVFVDGTGKFSKNMSSLAFSGIYKF
jgi:hypothetical protein